MPLLAKIDQEMHRESVDKEMDEHMLTETTDFIICPLLYAIAMGQVTNCQSWN